MSQQEQQENQPQPQSQQFHNKQSKSTKRFILRQSNAVNRKEQHQSLDSSLRRNTAFIKRLKTSINSPENVRIILREIETVSLDKYLSEISIGLNEGLTRCKTSAEVWGVVEIISALHQRFSTSFTEPFLQQFLAGLTPPSRTYLNSLTNETREREESGRITRQRSLLRLLAELDLVGLVRLSKVAESSGEEDGETTFEVLKDLLTGNKEYLTVPLPLATSFSKQFLPFYFPHQAGTATDQKQLEEGGAPSDSDDMILKDSLKEKFKRLFCQYFDVLSKKAVKDHIKLQELEKKNEEAAIRSGQIFEDRVQNFEKLSKEQEKLWTGILSLAETLSLTPPTLPTDTSTALQPSSITGTGVSSNFGTISVDPLGIWSDEEEKKFYEDLIDLRNEVPAMLLGLEAEAAKSPQEDEEASGIDGGEEKAALSSLEEEMEKLAIEDSLLSSSPETDQSIQIPSNHDQNQIGNEEETGPTTDDSALESSNGNSTMTANEIPSGPAARLTALFTRLEGVNSIEMIDHITVEFAYLNSKAARNRLVKFLGGVNRNRIDLIPYYCRMVATLSKYMPDISSGLFSIVEDEFRYFQRKKNIVQELYGSRSKNIKFISELTKFRLLKPHSILHLIKVLVDDLNNVNVDNLCNLLEGCGRFVLKDSKTNLKMVQLLEQMKKKKTSQNLDSRQVMMLENAYYQCDPGDRPIVEPKVRTPIELFIRYQMYDCLSKKTLDGVIKILRKLPWNDPTVIKLLKNIMTKVWKIKYGNIYLFAIVAYDLSKFHPAFTVSVVDQVLENIRFHMETNVFKLNQQRISSVKYLGELYNYRIIDSRVIFDTLWSFVTFGHLEGRPWPDVVSPIDTPDDFFRVRLVCTLLSTCGHCFDRGSLKKRLNNFLKFFIMYLRCKETPPMDVDFLLQDTFEELRPSLNLYVGYEESSKAVEEMFALNSQEGGKFEEDEARDDEGAGEKGEGDSSDSDNETVTKEGGNEDVIEEDQELPRNVVLTITAEEEEEFARELAKMVAETGGSQIGHIQHIDPAATDTRNVKRNPIISSNLFSDQGLPIIKTLLRHNKSTTQDDQGDQGDGMNFSLLTKKGNKQQIKTMKIPSSASIAVHTRAQQINSQVEHQQLKKFVLDYEQREEESKRKDLQADLARKGIHLKFNNE